MHTTETGEKTSLALNLVTDTVPANVLGLDDVHMKKIELSNCALGDGDLTQLWSGLAGQAETIEWIDTSNNNGTVGFETITYTLRQLRNIKKLNISGNTRLISEEPLFAEGALNSWALQELDLSGIVVRTVGRPISYLQLTLNL